MKVVAIIGSKRKNGIINRITDTILIGASNKGCSIEKINLYDYKLEPCNGCCSCLNNGKCYQKDDFQYILNTTINSDALIIGTPVYYGNVSGIIKNFIDRHFSLGIGKIEENKKAEIAKSTFMKKLTLLLKINRINNERKKQNPFYRKKIISIMAMTKPFPFSHFYPFDIIITKAAIDKFIYQIGGKRFKRIVFTDSLFRFNKNKEKITLGKALLLGHQLNSTFSPATSRQFVTG